MTEPDSIGDDAPDENALELMDTPKSIDPDPEEALTHPMEAAADVGPPLSAQAKDANYASHESWSKEDLERLRLCRNRAYYKVNSKRRQHLQASLSTYLHKEWVSHYPDRGLSAKDLLKVYMDHFEPEQPQRKVNPWHSRGRGRGRGVAAAPRMLQKDPVPVEIPDGPKVEDHSDKQWTEGMMSNLMLCNQIVSQKQAISPPGDKFDFSTSLYEEWKKIYPDSTLTARNIKSRFTVYVKTMGEVPPPSKRRKISTESNAAAVLFQWTSDKKDKLMAVLDEVKKNEDTSNFSEDELASRVFQEWTKIEAGGTLQDVKQALGLMVVHSKKPFSVPSVAILPEVVDEFVPENDNGIVVKQDSICSKNHWVHLFSDKDVTIECILTDQLLSMRESLKASFLGCDIYKPKKPKGLSSSVLDEWRKLYPNSEETVKTIAFKLSKYDRGPGEHCDRVVKMSPSGRIMWSPQMLQKLQEARQVAQGIVARSGHTLSLNKTWRDEWQKLYPDLNLDWRTVLSRYNYHFGNLDTISSSLKEDHEAKFDGSKMDFFENGGSSGKVKGFRNWTQIMEQDLLITKAKVLKADPALDKGSSEFNRALLKEFLKLYPKCMESARSLYSKLQSVEKDLASSPAKAFDPPSRSSSIDSVSKEASQDQQVGEAAVKNGTNGEQLEIKKEVLDTQLVDCNLKAEADYPPSQIEGFEEWNLPMIRDFIGCMDSSRKKFATLKEQDPEGQVKLVPLLLDEWKLIHPETPETLADIKVKIKHLKSQKEVIKKHLGIYGLLPKMDGVTPEAPEAEPSAIVEEAIRPKEEDIKMEPMPEAFKWHRDMIPDVIESRRNALQIKDDELARGNKVSFHSLWAQEFKKIHPTSTFTSNNLSVHFWTWRKQQEKQRKKMKLESPATIEEPKPELEPKEENVAVEPIQPALPVKKPPSTSNGTFKDAIAREKLITIGRKVEQMLQNPETPNELKLKGFANVLLEEWSKECPNSSESSRSLNMMYSRLLRQDQDPEPIIHATWTPKHNGVLFSCMEEFKADYAANVMTEGAFFENVIKSWRSKFPKSSVLHETLVAKIRELEKESDEGNIFEPITIPKKISTNSSVKRATRISIDKSSLDVRRPNSRGQMNWNKLAIKDLLECHIASQKQLKNMIGHSGKRSCPKLSELVHRKFVELHPYCKLTPAILMTKCYTYKSAIEKGNLQIEINSSNIKFEPSSEPMTDMPAARIKRSSSRDLVFRTWTQEMIDNMLKTRKIALLKKKKMGITIAGSGGKSDLVTLTEIWHEEFLKLHPDYKSSKKNLWRKYKWYKSRMAEMAPEDRTHELVDEMSSYHQQQQDINLEFEQNQQPLLRMKNIRKDVFSYIKAVLQESRIYLPMKLPEDTQFPQFIQHDALQASTTLASFHQQSLSIPKTQTPWIMPQLTIPVIHSEELQVEAAPQNSASQGDSSSIKLPGGATLVAVTDRNADLLLKPKQLEKPHVTITIGDKQLEQQPQMMTAIMSTPTAQIPLSIPYLPNLVQPPPLPQLKPYGVEANQFMIPPKIKARLIELGITDPMFGDLIKMYDSVRDEYIQLMKKGFLVFFPYLFGTRWRQSRPNSMLTGRKLTTLIDMYGEERRRGMSISPEYLTKSPCGFEVTELVLKQILVCYAETKRFLFSDEPNPDEIILDLDGQARVYTEMIKRWAKIHPEIRMTAKQMISVHHMLNFEPGKDDPSPEIVCYLTETLRHMDKEVPLLRAVDHPEFDESDFDHELDMDLDQSYDESNLSMEQLQELFLATQGLKTVEKSHTKRPRFTAKKQKLFWTSKRVDDLYFASMKALQRFKCAKKKSFGDLMHKEWIRMNPGCSAITKHQVLARYKSQIRLEKKAVNMATNQVIACWQVMCDSYRISEENIEVIDESNDQFKAELEEVATTIKAENIKMEYNGNVECRDYNKDEDVLSYMKDQQNASKSQHAITWTPDVVADLIEARREARRRKKVWETWAIKKYGGVGIAYNNPNVTFSKVDDMFKEEWAKRRPELANLSIWTLVSYARKFDTLKKQLILQHNQVYRGGDRRRKDYIDEPLEMRVAMQSTVVYFEDSSIPKYDLDEVNNLELSQDLKDLLITRQLAKIRQSHEKEASLSLNFLWEDEWKKLHPDDVDVGGAMLMQKLYLLENRPMVKQQLKQVVLRSSQNVTLAVDNEDEVLKVKPRHFVFPEADREGLNVFCYIDIPLPKGPKERWYVELERDVYNKDTLLLPMLEDGRGPADEEDEVTKFPAKAYNHWEHKLSAKVEVSPTETADFECKFCRKVYSNFNNLKYHQELHHPLLDFAIQNETVIKEKNPDIVI